MRKTLTDTAYDIVFHPKFADNGYFYVGSNGYLTFGSSDTEYNESLAAHSKCGDAGAQPGNNDRNCCRSISLANAGLAAETR